MKAKLTRAKTKKTTSKNSALDKKKPKAKKQLTIPLQKAFKGFIAVCFILFLSVMLLYVYSVLKYKVKNVLVEEINIVNASDYVAKYLKNELEFIKGQKVSEVDIHEVRRYIASIDWVVNASVRKDYTGSLSIKVLEPSPYFLWINEDSVFYINSSKEIVRRFNRNIDKDLIKIYEGENALEDLDLIRFVIYKDLEVLKSIDRLVYNGYRWDIHLKNGIKIMMPETNLSKAWDNVLYFDKEHDILSRNIKSIDARIVDRISIIPNEPKDEV